MSPGAIVDLSGERPAEELTVEVCVIGSGSGGATAAWELARAGHEVLVLEEGGDFTGPKMSQRDAAMYDQLYMDRGGRATADLAISVMQGRVLGGGGVINAADVVPMADETLVHWQRRWGLTDFSPEALAPFRDAALRDLSAAKPPPELINLNNKLLKQGAEALGLRGDFMLHNRVGCAGVGACLLGCPIDSKQSPRKVAVPRAIEAGARFFVRARALFIEHAGAELKTVHACSLDPRGHREQHPFRVRARVVIVAANAIGSAQLLLRSGIGNQHVGRHLMLQPQQPITAFTDELVRAFRMIPQSYAVTHFEVPATPERSWTGFRIEAIGGTPGIVATLLPASGPAGKELMTRYARMMSALLLTPDEPSGHVELERSGRLRIRYSLAEEHKERLREATRTAAKIYFAAGAQEVLVPSQPAISLRSAKDLDRISALTYEPATVPLISAHQMGTVRFSPNERDGGANPDGQVYGTRDVYVFDTSGFPSSASSHTMTPAITIARFLTRKLLSRLSR